MVASVVAIPEDWRKEAVCAELDPDAWFPDSGEGEEAKRVCLEQCPVRRPCGLAAVKTGDRWGIAAGFDLCDPDQRAELRKYLGLHADAPHVLTCTECTAEFESRRIETLCPGCRDRVDVSPVHARVRALRSVMSAGDIAAAAAVSISTVHVLSKPECRWRTILQDKAERILAVPMPEVEG